MSEEEEPWDNWYRVKEKLRMTWDLSEEELEHTRGNLSEITQLILNKHEETKQSVVKKLVQLIHQEDEYQQL